MRPASRVRGLPCDRGHHQRIDDDAAFRMNDDGIQINLLETIAERRHDSGEACRGFAE